MKNEKRRCLLILPYFGTFNNYFFLFLKSCAQNKMIDWLIFTDVEERYDYPENVTVVRMTLEMIKKRADKKFGFSVSLKTPYKLCDYKPCYGFLFEEYLTQYDYWGHCDCDLIFGNLDKILVPLLDKGYDKLFAAGHLTIYKNTYENNRRFMNQYKGKLLYKDAFTTEQIYVFDEDFNNNNVHSIFLDEGASIYTCDLSMNVDVRSARLIRAYYEPQLRKFIKEKYKKAWYFWDKGALYSLTINGEKVEKTEYIYMHLQQRRMRIYKGTTESDVIQIFADHFAKCTKIPGDYKELKNKWIGVPYYYWFDRIRKKIKKDIKSLMQGAD